PLAALLRYRCQLHGRCGEARVTATPWLWAIFTVAAAFAQTIRNAMQRELTAALGTAGATQVRFLFGFPFALVFLAILVAKTGAPLPRPGLMFWAWVLAGAFTQILATALMLAAMGERSRSHRNSGFSPLRWRPRQA